MQCPKCGSNTTVYETRPAGPMRVRLRQCKTCGHCFRTGEEYIRDVQQDKTRPRKRRINPPNPNQVDWTDLVQEQ